MAEYKVGFIGAGNIATAIFSGIIGSGYIKPENVIVFDSISEKTSTFALKGAKVGLSAVDVTKQSDFVFLTVKPQIYAQIIDSIKSVSNDTCFIDVAAGISISYIKELLGYNAPVIRVMPNTPLMYGLGASALVKEDPVTDEQFSFVRGCFESSGVTCVVKEELIDIITAVSGSAPAYIMRVMKTFIDFAVGQGMNSEDAEKMILSVFSGTAKMVECDPRTIDELIRMVTSPKGTTEAGLSSLDANMFDNVLEDCLKSTVKRAKELSK